MRAKYISELCEGARFEGTCAIRSKELRTTRAGDPYLALELADRSGSIPAVCFRPDADARAIPVGAVVRVDGLVTSYRRLRRLRVDHMSPAAEFDPADLIASSGLTHEELEAELSREIRGVGDPALRAVLRHVFGDAAFRRRFLESPATQAEHHVRTGGLAEHTIAVVGLCREASRRYETVDHDLLAAAALLHDIGVVDEIGEGYPPLLTDEGRLVGHVTLGHDRVRDACRLTRLSSGRAACLAHAVLAHHDDPVSPDGPGAGRGVSTAEALILRHADRMDALVDTMTTSVGFALMADERWTDSRNGFHTPLFVPRVPECDRGANATDRDAMLRSA